MKKSAIVSENRLLRDIAEIAAEADGFETFRQAALGHLLLAIGAEAGAFCTKAGGCPVLSILSHHMGYTGGLAPRDVRPRDPAGGVRPSNAHHRA
jgi:hypothetical protein